MMPTIRIDDDVFKALQALAEPFTDTPNTVIRRLLAERGAGFKPSPAPRADQRTGASSAPRTATGSGSRASKGDALTPQPIYEQALLYVLGREFSGRGPKREVTDAVISALEQQGFIGEQDRKRVSTGETRAENTIAWARNALKERGLIRDDSARGVWVLTPTGVEESMRTDLPRSAHTP